MSTTTLQIINNEILISAVSSFLGAFFAFVFFIASQKWLDYRERKNKLVSNYKIIKDYLAELVYYFENNKTLASSYISDEKSDPVAIHLDRFISFPEISFNYYDFYKEKDVIDDFKKFSVYIKQLNISVESKNKYLDVISDFSREAMLSGKQEAFKPTMNDKRNELKNVLKNFLDFSKKSEEKIDVLHKKLDKVLTKYKI